MNENKLYGLKVKLQDAGYCEYVDRKAKVQMTVRSNSDGTFTAKISKVESFFGRYPVRSRTIAEMLFFNSSMAVSWAFKDHDLTSYLPRFN